MARSAKAPTRATRTNARPRGRRGACHSLPEAEHTLTPPPVFRPATPTCQPLNHRRAPVTPASGAQTHGTDATDGSEPARRRNPQQQPRPPLSTGALTCHPATGPRHTRVRYERTAQTRRIRPSTPELGAQSALTHPPAKPRRSLLPPEGASDLGPRPRWPSRGLGFGGTPAERCSLQSMRGSGEQAMPRSQGRRRARVRRLGGQR